MFDQSPSPVMQRVDGAARVRLSTVGLRDLYQRGSAKALLPKVHGSPPEVVFLNTAGGVTGGDLLRYELTLEAGTRATGTTQTAERAYAATGAPGRIDVTLTVGAGARLDWLPQETILFQDARLARHTTARLSGDAALLFCETLVIGRTAMGERLTRLDLVDRRRVLRDGVPVLIEPLRLCDEDLARQSVAGLNGHLALATLALVAPGAEDAVAPLRRLIGETPGFAVSGWDGKCVVRAMGRDALHLRRTLVRLIRHLRGAPLPRVWPTS